MWGLSRPEIAPMSPASWGRFLTTGPPGKPLFSFLKWGRPLGRSGHTWCKAEWILWLSWEMATASPGSLGMTAPCPECNWHAQKATRMCFHPMFRDGEMTIRAHLRVWQSLGCSAGCLAGPRWSHSSLPPSAGRDGGVAGSRLILIQLTKRVPSVLMT